MKHILIAFRFLFKKDHPQTSGGTVPTLKELIPEIELATRFTDFGEWTFTDLFVLFRYLVCSCLLPELEGCQYRSGGELQTCTTIM